MPFGVESFLVASVCAGVIVAAVDCAPDCVAASVVGAVDCLGARVAGVNSCNGTWADAWVCVCTHTNVAHTHNTALRRMDVNLDVFV